MQEVNVRNILVLIKPPENVKYLIKTIYVLQIIIYHCKINFSQNSLKNLQNRLKDDES